MTGSNDTLPRLGQTVRGSTTGQPINVLFDLLSRRWAMGIIWQLHNRNLTFRELRAACDDVSPTVLNTRLKELRATKLIEHNGAGYHLTKHGQTLYIHLKPMGVFAKKWVEIY